MSKMRTGINTPSLSSAWDWERNAMIARSASMAVVRTSMTVSFISSLSFEMSVIKKTAQATFSVFLYIEP